MAGNIDYAMAFVSQCPNVAGARPDWRFIIALAVPELVSLVYSFEGDHQEMYRLHGFVGISSATMPLQQASCYQSLAII